MSPYRVRTALVGFVLTIFAPGCSDDIEAPIEKSPHAPTKAQIDEMTNSVLRKGKTAKAPAEAPAKAPAEAPAKAPAEAPAKEPAKEPAEAPKS